MKLFWQVFCNYFAIWPYEATLVQQAIYGSDYARTITYTYMARPWLVGRSGHTAICATGGSKWSDPWPQKS